MSTASNSSLKQSRSALTSVTSALEVIFNVTRSINPRFTYVLTLLTYLLAERSGRPTWIWGRSWMTTGSLTLIGVRRTCLSRTGGRVLWCAITRTAKTITGVTCLTSSHSWTDCATDTAPPRRQTRSDNTRTKYIQLYSPNIMIVRKWHIGLPCRRCWHMGRPTGWCHHSTISASDKKSELMLMRRATASV